LHQITALVELGQSDRVVDQLDDHAHPARVIGLSHLLPHFLDRLLVRSRYAHEPAGTTKVPAGF
jgi:hypothetical protein